MSLRNYKSNKLISLVNINNEFINTCQNLYLTIWKIGESNDNYSSPDEYSESSNEESSDEESSDEDYNNKKYTKESDNEETTSEETASEESKNQEHIE